MTATSERIESERRGAPELLRPTLVVGAGVLAVQAAQLVAGALINLLSYGSLPNPVVVVVSAGEQTLFLGLPFALGAFLTLWLVRPILARSSVWQVIGTGAIASVGGGILLFVVQLTLQLLRSPEYSLMGRIPGVNPFYSVGTALNSMVSGIPLVVLGSVLLWLYLRRRAA